MTLIASDLEHHRQPNFSRIPEEYSVYNIAINLPSVDKRDNESLAVRTSAGKLIGLNFQRTPHLSEQTSGTFLTARI